MKFFFKILLLALFAFQTVAQDAGEAPVILLNEDGTPRCKVGGPYGRHLPPERFADFFANADGFPEELRKCGEEDVLYAHMVLSPEEIRWAALLSESQAAILIGGAVLMGVNAVGSCLIGFNYKLPDAKAMLPLGIFAVLSGTSLASNIIHLSGQLGAKAMTPIFIEGLALAGVTSAMAYFLCRRNVESAGKFDLAKN